MLIVEVGWGGFQYASSPKLGGAGLGPGSAGTVGMSSGGGAPALGTSIRGPRANGPTVFDFPPTRSVHLFAHAVSTTR